MHTDLSATANLLGEPGRAAILLSLMGGIALPAGELARIANVAPQTASAHLSKLLDGKLLTVERQGRHRYYRLSSVEVADAVEALLTLSQISQVRPRETHAPGTLRHARTCYAHLAGALAVQIADALEERSWLTTAGPKDFTITAAGQAWFESLGVPDTIHKTARRCLDWTERRHHIAGPLGCALYKRFTELGWLAKVRDTRAVRVTLEGKNQFWKQLRIPLS